MENITCHIDPEKKMYLESYHIYKMELFMKMVIGFQPLIIFTKIHLRCLTNYQIHVQSQI